MKKFKLKDKVYFYNKYTDEIIYGEIIGERQAKYNWDFKLRYLLRADTMVWYEIWIEEKYIEYNKSKLEFFLKI